jgi:uncharacterized protein (TIGR04255 family)
MNQKVVSDKTLTQNGINHFILRFDLSPLKEIDFISIINNISESADRTEKRIKTGIKVDIKNGKSEVTNLTNIDYVLINDTTGVSITFSKDPNAFWFETKQYLDNSSYKYNIASIIHALNEYDSSIMSKRIGMRFINEFKCPTVKKISKIYNIRLAKNIALMADQEFASRIIGHEEFNYSNYKLRVQYGIPNKFYPSVLNNYDLLLDIDAFDDTQQKLERWESIISDLNHLAYSKFIEVMNPKFIQTLK